MNVLIAGGSGLLGTALAEDLIKNGHAVWVLTRRPEGATLPRGVQAVGWDGASGRGWEGVLEQADALVNLVGENIGARPWSNERKRQIRASRVQAGQAIVEALRGAAHRPRVLLQIAGVGYYGPRGDEIVTEQSAKGSDFLAGVSEDWEESTRAAEALGVRRVVMRSAAVLTPAGGILPRFVWPVRMFVGGPLGSGRQWVSWIHIHDHLAAIRFLMENESAVGVFNLSSPGPVTNAEFMRTIAQVLGRPYWLSAPAFALRILLGEMSTLVLDGQRVIPQRLMEMGFQFAYPELRPALEDLLRDTAQKT